ncbi:F-box associated domain type 3 [Arabidopsis suecica]|uniref:F-box associated domain type 3 n=1 Tax=Arabidopsis suecica TaxID=45249 RepID=A0A8T2AE32_ARASU|nr:F-box associated domain type 3 [Arabidopsis suecica]
MKRERAKLENDRVETSDAIVEITPASSKRQTKKISDDRSKISDLLPIDLKMEILKRLPVKTLARFLCLSKEYASIISCRDFMKLYLTESTNSPQSLIFTFESKTHRKHFFFSASPWEQEEEDEMSPQNEDESSSSACVATYHMKCHSQPYTTVAPSVHGLICYGHPSKLMVYNPSTRRSITLPKIDSQRINMYHFLGYDPIHGDYKVLCMTVGMHVYKGRGMAQELRVLTLGNGNSWRLIEDFPPHFLDYHYSPDICINGVLYYGALLDIKRPAVMSFDVKSEKFHLIKGPDRDLRPKLKSFNGKLVVLFSTNGGFELWVLEDAVKHEWEKKLFVSDIDCWRNGCMFQAFCLTDEGEFIFAPRELGKPPFSLLYYDPQENTEGTVHIEGITELKLPLWDNDSDRRLISIFSGQVENLMCL